MLLALSLPLQKTILAHAHWTVQQKKMSKSIGNVADPLEAMNAFGVDVVRYYLTRVGGRFRDDVGTFFHFILALAFSDECGV
jgi:methionyl-tRNA synthetase